MDEAGLAATVDRIERDGGKARGLVTDVRSRVAVDDLAGAAQSGGGIDVWANVAGIILSAPIVEMTEEQLDAIVAVNVKGVFFGCAAAARAMVPRGHGSIINVSSAGGEMPGPGISAYSLTKAAVIMLTRSLALELGPDGIRANAVAPGFTETPMVARHYRNADGSVDEGRRRSVLGAHAAQSPLGLTGEPIDISLGILYLASDASRFVTGQVLRINGGVFMG